MTTARLPTSSICATVGRELIGIIGGASSVLAVVVGCLVDSKVVLGRTKAEGGGGSRRDVVSEESSICCGTSDLLGLDGIRGGIVGVGAVLALGKTEADRVGRSGALTAGILDFSLASLNLPVVVCASLSLRLGGSGGNFVESSVGARTLRAGSGSVDPVLVREATGLTGGSKIVDV